jgi:hypothetical protein
MPRRSKGSRSRICRSLCALPWTSPARRAETPDRRGEETEMGVVPISRSERAPGKSEERWQIK